MSKKVKVSRFSAPGEPSPNSGKYVMFALAALVLILTGFTIGKVTTSRSKDTNSAINTVKKTPIGEVVSSNGPKKTIGIVPTGFKHSTEGAVTAATAYVGLTPRLYFANDTAFNTSVVQFVSPTFQQSFLEGIASNRATVRATYKADPNTFFREMPLGFYVQSEAKNQVTVYIWSEVMLVARPDFDGKTESKMHTITLVWEDNDWKVANWTTQAGPTPQWQAPSSTILSVDDFLTLIQPFSGGYDYVPSF